VTTGPAAARRAPLALVGDAAAAAEVQRGGMSDGAIVREILAGDRERFAVLVDRHAAACLRFATRMLGNREDAEDATQETLVRAFDALGRFDQAATFRTWLFAILVNRCRTAAVRRARQARLAVDDARALARVPAAGDAASALEAGEIDGTLARALADLAPEFREAFLLKHVEELSYEEMSEITGAGVSALKMRVKRACDRLRRRLEGVKHVHG
jgi:RNA polymerase sigma-70 factor (ECF subfamily)